MLSVAIFRGLAGSTVLLTAGWSIRAVESMVGQLRWYQVDGLAVETIGRPTYSKLFSLGCLMSGKETPPNKRRRQRVFCP